MPSKSQFNTLQNGLTYTPIYFYEQTSHIRGAETNFTVSPLSTNGLLKNTLEQEQWINASRNFERLLLEKEKRYPILKISLRPWLQVNCAIACNCIK